MKLVLIVIMMVAMLLVPVAAFALNPEPHIPGDANSDGIVNAVDFSILAMCYGSVVGDGVYQERADFNLDGIVNIVDFTILAANYLRYNP